MSQITPAEVRALAALARLALGEEEVAALTEELGAILGHMRSLAAVDVRGVEPMTHAVPITLPLREDLPEGLASQLPAEVALAAAARTRDGFFAVPKVIEVDE